MIYQYKEPLKGDVIRIKMGLYHHYGLYFGDENVLEFRDPLNKKLKDLNKAMREAAANLEFEQAMVYRDEIKKLEEMYLKNS